MKNSTKIIELRNMRDGLGLTTSTSSSYECNQFLGRGMSSLREDASRNKLERSFSFDFSLNPTVKHSNGVKSHYLGHQLTSHLVERTKEM